MLYSILIITITWQGLLACALLVYGSFDYLLRAMRAKWTPRRLARTMSWDFRLDGKHLFPCRNLERYEQVDSSPIRDEDTVFVRPESPEEDEKWFRLSDYDLPQGPHTYSIQLCTDMAPPSVREKHLDVLQGYVRSNTATFTYAPPPRN